MLVHTDYLWFNTKRRQEFIRITDEIGGIVRKSGVKEGTVLVSAMHITAGVFVNDWETGLIHDFQIWLEKLAPAGLDYQHHQTGEDNADAHLKRTIMGHQVVLPITGGATRSGAVGAGVLRRVRRPAQEACRREGDGHMRDFPDRPMVGVGAVVIDDAGRVLLAKRAHEPLKGEWSLPGGAVELGESLEAAVVREVLEETGLVVLVGPVVEVFERVELTGDGRVAYHFVIVDYLCRPVDGRLASGSDADDVSWVSLDQLVEYRVTSKATEVIGKAIEIRRRESL